MDKKNFPDFPWPSTTFFSNSPTFPDFPELRWFWYDFPRLSSLHTPCIHLSWFESFNMLVKIIRNCWPSKETFRRGNARKKFKISFSGRIFICRPTDSIFRLTCDQNQGICPNWRKNCVKNETLYIWLLNLVTQILLANV